MKRHADQSSKRVPSFAHSAWDNIPAALLHDHTVGRISLGTGSIVNKYDLSVQYRSTECKIKESVTTSSTIDDVQQGKQYRVGLLDEACIIDQ